MKNIKRWRRTHAGLPIQVSITEMPEGFVVSMLGSPITVQKYESLEEAKSGADSRIAELYPLHSCEKSQCGDWQASVGGIDQPQEQ